MKPWEDQVNPHGTLAPYETPIALTINIALMANLTSVKKTSNNLKNAPKF